MDPRKQAICNALDRWIRQRPGLEFGNYGEVKAYHAELRSIAKDLQHARTLLRYVELRDSITAEHLLAAQRAYSGRLSIKLYAPRESQGPERCEIDYCTGQYWPTEYRRAVCAVLASAIWDWHRDECMPSAIVKDGEKVYPHSPGSKNTVSAGTWLRSSLRREFGRAIQARWMD